MSSVWFLSAALDDVEQAWRWYERERPGLGRQFREALQSAVDRIVDDPLVGRAVYRDTRRGLLERFPYCLCYRTVGDGTVIVALLHAARDPDSERRRLHS